jgi:hypothetical protein
VADQYVQIAPDSTGKKVDVSELTVSSNTVERQRIVIADPSSATGLAPVDPTNGLSVNVTNTSISDQHTNITADYDTSAGTQNLTIFGIALPASGGAVAGGTASNPVRTDPTGTTTQPVSGTVTVQQSTAANLKVDLSGTGANATALKVDGSGVTQPVSGTVTANAGTGTFAISDANLELSQASTTSGQKGPLIQGAVTTNVPSYTTGQTDPISLDTSGLLRVSIKDTPQNTNAFKVDGSAVTQPISASSLPLPTGAATAAKQPALGTAGSASADVITVQGIASMTALKVDGSAVTQPVSGTVTANAGSGNFATNTAQINGSTVSTAATGVQKVGIVGNGGAAVDATVGAGTAPANAIVGASVYNSSAPAPTNGQSMALQADQSGNLRTLHGIATATLSAWNSATALNATQTIFTNSGATAAIIQLVQTSTLTAGAVTFEVSYDGSNWVTIPANCVFDPTSTTYATISLPYTLQASTNKAFILSSNGWQALRIKLSTQITGTGTVTPNYALVAFDPVLATLAYSPTAANFNVTAVQSGTWADNLTQIAGNAIATAASGIAKVGLTDGSGNAINSTSNALNVNVNNTPSVTQSGTWTVQPGNTANTTPWLVQNNAGTAGGWSVNSQTALTNTKVAVKATGGNFGGYMIYNPNASAIYIQMFDVASASVTLGTTTPTYVIPLPATAAANIEWSNGITHTTAITLAATTTPTGSTAPGTSLTGFFLFK